MPGSSSRKPVRGRGVGGRRSGWVKEWVEWAIAVGMVSARFIERFFSMNGKKAEWEWAGPALAQLISSAFIRFQLHSSRHANLILLLPIC